MPFLAFGSRRIRYELAGPASGPAYVLVNGLTQYAELWAAYRDALVAQQFRVVTFDLLGQGASDKPGLFISQDDQVEASVRGAEQAIVPVGSLLDAMPFLGQPLRQVGRGLAIILDQQDLASHDFS